MKTFGILAAALLIPIAAWADTINSTGVLVGVPSNFQSTTGTPFWNNNSIDGANMNVGDFLTGSNPSLGSTNYLGADGSYLSTGGPAPDAPNFTFLKSAVTVQATLLFSEGPANYPYSSQGMVGTQIGLYNVADPTVNETLFAAGTLFNLGAPNGVINNNVTPQAPVTVGSWDNYGVYAYTCGYSANGSPFCHMYYSNAALNQNSDPSHEHFSLFQDSQNPYTYYIGFEEGLGSNATEGYGDYNDVIFKLETTQLRSVTDEIPPPAVTPEPATWSAMALGLLTIGFLGRRAKAVKVS